MIAVGILSFSCRDIQPLESSSTIAGYQVKGIVTGQDGLPIDAVNVRVYYYYDLLRNTPIDTLPVLVTDSTKIVDIAVYTSSFHLVREIFLGYRSPGRVPHYQWDGRDDNNKPVPNGKYFVRYVIDTTIVKFSTIIIDGHISATSDSSGHFTLTSDRLPVGEVFDHYLSNNTYEGTYRVLPEIDLVVEKALLIKSYAGIHLESGTIISVALKLE